MASTAVMTARERAQGYFDQLIEAGLVDRIEERIAEQTRFQDEHPEEFQRDPSAKMTRQEMYCVAFYDEVENLADKNLPEVV